MRRSWRKMLISAAILVLALLVAMALQIDDWSRDLSTNHAATSVDAQDPTLRTLVLEASTDEVRAAIASFVEQSPAWKYGEAADKNSDTSDNTDTNQDAATATISLVRVTRFFRFADDVTVVLESADAGTLVDATSQSRVGKGDLGQNPRNIRELLHALRDQLN